MKRPASLLKKRLLEQILTEHLWTTASNLEIENSRKLIKFALHN